MAKKILVSDRGRFPPKGLTRNSQMKPQNQTWQMETPFCQVIYIIKILTLLRMKKDHLFAPAIQFKLYKIIIVFFLSFLVCVLKY